MSRTTPEDAYEIDILIQGYPGKTVCHGGLGWSTVALLRGRKRVILVDAGAFNMRRAIVTQLAERGLTPADVTDVILTHAHYDHAINWVMFPNARVLIGAKELAWAAAQPLGHMVVPEFYIYELAKSAHLHAVQDGEEVIPGMVAHMAAGHTPGHLIFHLSAPERDVIFTGDSAKNRAELLCMTADMTMDEDASRRSIEQIWSLWRRRPETLLVPGHDIPMVLRDDRPVYIEGRRAGITAQLGDTLEQTTLFELAGPDDPPVRQPAQRTAHGR
jgi:glyoxylase-like metal-dependent hydrolase (beta-lactamase superfamily II)